MGNSASALPYSIGKPVVVTSSSSDHTIVPDGWILHDGSRKSDNAAVSVFVAKKPNLLKSMLLGHNSRGSSSSSLSSSHLNQLAPALHHFQYSKKLRHPHILQVLATLDTDHPTETTDHHHAPTSNNANTSSTSSSTAATAASKETGDLIIVTEPCVPLETWLNATPRPTPEQVAWGLESIVRALHFLHSSAQLSHGNVSPSSLFVTRSGDVKLWNFALVTPITPDVGVSWHFQEYESLLTPISYRSPERIDGRYKELAATGGTTSHVHAMDSYSMGVLIPYFFQGTTPSVLQKAVQRMMTPSIKMRPRLQPLLKCPLFQTPYQQFQLQVEELPIQPIEQKIVFWQHVSSQLQSQSQQRFLPDHVAYYKLLPLLHTSIHTIADSESLRAQDLYRRELLAMLHPFFFVVERYTASTSNTATTDHANQMALIEKTIASLFRVNDRGIRGTLLQKMSYLSQTLDAHALNNSVFEPLCSGFSDSSAALRELTLKSTLVLVPHLTQPNLEKLSRYLVRLQSDPEPSIRTNTIIFCSKLAPHLTETTRQKMLLPALVRALKDNFTPCRLAALQSVLQTKEFFDPPAIATSVLPVVTPQLLDSVAEVRREAFLVVDDLLFLLRQESTRMPNQAQMESAGAASSQPPSHAPAPSSGPVPPIIPTPVAPAPASGGYLSGLSSWVTSSAKPSATPTPVNPPPLPPPSQVPIPAARVSSAPPPVQALSSMQLHHPTAASADFDLDDDNDGWGDDDDVDDDLGRSSRSATSQPRGAVAAASPSGGFLAPAKEDDFFGAFDSKPASRPIGGAAASGVVKARKGKLMVPSSARSPATATSKAAKPAVTKLDLDDDPVGDAWDDF